MNKRQARVVAAAETWLDTEAADWEVQRQAKSELRAAIRDMRAARPKPPTED
jgi:hypothetical protein